jgi:hypothetical protein
LRVQLGFVKQANVRLVHQSSPDSLAKGQGGSRRQLIAASVIKYFFGSFGLTAQTRGVDLPRAQDQKTDLLNAQVAIAAELLCRLKYVLLLLFPLSGP